MRGFPLTLNMAEPVLEFRQAQHRHRVPQPRWFKPWANRLGPGIVNLDLTLHRGAVLGLVGPNGAGKTTLLRMMAGILPLQEGSVVSHITSGDNGTEIDLRKWVGHMPEQVRWQGRITVQEALAELGAMRGTDIKRIQGLLALVGLKQRAEEPLDNLSQGMRQRLSIAAAMLGSPKVLLLDEPYNGLDPVAAEAFTQLIKRLANKGVSIVISSHMVGQLTNLIDRIALIHRGQLLDEGRLSDVETRLNLDSRHSISGEGDVDFTSILDGVKIQTMREEVEDQRWNLIFRGNPTEVLQSFMKAKVTVTSWSPVAPNLVEWLCAATGMDVEDITLEVGSSAMLPLRRMGGAEDE